MRKFFSNQKTSSLAIIFSLSLIIRLFLFSVIYYRNPQGFFQADSYGYWQIAQNIIQQGAFSKSTAPPFIPDHTRTPVYPLFLSMLQYLGLNSFGIILISILLSAITCLLVISLTEKLTDNWQAALIAGTLAALDIPSISLANCLLTETLFTFIFVCSIILLAAYLKNKGKSSLIASGILMGMAILCRPVAFFLPFFMIFFLLRPKSKKSNILTIFSYLLACFLVLFPWYVRNQIVFGEPFLSTVGNNNLIYCRAAGVYAIKNKITLGEAQELIEKDLKRITGTNMEDKPIEYLNSGAKYAVSVILTHPVIYIQNHIRAVFNMLFNPLRGTIDLQLGLTNKYTTLTSWGVEDKGSFIARLLQKTSVITVILVGIQLFFLIIIWTSFIYGAIALIVNKKLLAFSLIIFIILYFALVSGGPEAYARFRVPLIPFIAIASGFGMIKIYQRFSQA